jgi:undecaprenyl-diphosphatase
VRSSTLLGVVLAVSLVAYAVIAADVVNGGRLSSFDETLSSWVARSMPTWAEWLARPFSWVGGVVGVTLVVAAAVVWLVRRREPHLGALVIVVALGAQVLTTLAKNGFDRPRPTAGSPIDVPSSFSFPSGHALSGIAVFGLLGLIAARELPAHARRGRLCARWTDRREPHRPRRPLPVGRARGRGARSRLARRLPARGDARARVAPSLR